VIPNLVGDLIDRLRHVPPRVIDEDIDLAERRNRPLGQSFQFPAVRHVGRERTTLACDSWPISAAADFRSSCRLEIATFAPASASVCAIACLAPCYHQSQGGAAGKIKECGRHLDIPQLVRFNVEA
jgi:hypothetical protein